MLQGISKTTLGVKLGQLLSDATKAVDSKLYPPKREQRQKRKRGSQDNPEDEPVDEAADKAPGSDAELDSILENSMAALADEDEEDVSQQCIACFQIVAAVQSTPVQNEQVMHRHNQIAWPLNLHSRPGNIAAMGVAGLLNSIAALAAINDRGFGLSQHCIIASLCICGHALVCSKFVHIVGTCGVIQHHCIVSMQACELMFRFSTNVHIFKTGVTVLDVTAAITTVEICPVSQNGCLDLIALETRNGLNCLLSFRVDRRDCVNNSLVASIGKAVRALIQKYARCPLATQVSDNLQYNTMLWPKSHV